MDELEKEGKWAIVLTAAGKFLGVVDKQGDKVRLECVYELQVGQVMTPQGPTLQRNLFPFLLFTTDFAITVEPIGVVMLSEMGEADRAELYRLVRMVRDGMRQMRAAAAGITLASKLPGMS